MRGKWEISEKSLYLKGLEEGRKKEGRGEGWKDGGVEMERQRRRDYLIWSVILAKNSISDSGLSFTIDRVY